MELYTLNVEYQMKILELSSCVPNSAIKKLYLLVNFLIFTVTFTYNPDRNAPITTHHPYYQSHYSSNYQS